MALPPPGPLLLALLAAVALPTRAAADVDTLLPRTTVTLQPLGLLDAAVEVELERVLGPTVTFYVSPRLKLGPGAFGADGADVLGVRGSVGARLFGLGGEAPEGLWAGPEVGVGWMRATLEGRRVEGLETRVLAMAGLTWLVDDVFVMSGGAGAGVGRGIVDLDDVERDTGLSFVWSLRLAVGFAF